MSRRVNRPRPSRPYHAPRRTAAAAQTRQAILRAAKEQFEARGWAATTVRSIAESAGVSPKTVEALFATKPALLEATLMVAFGGDAADTGNGAVAVLRPESVLEMRGEAARGIEEAQDATRMLELLAALVREINARAERICWAVETAYPSDERIAELWVRLLAAQRFGVHWSAEVLLQKPGVRPGLTLRDARETILAGCDWNTYRTLTMKGGLTPEAVQAWTMRYFRCMLLP
jgi:TetR/AcrR family transcriptional regulator, regulator of cefoperazone and chloramphenicol sensitivity